MKIHRLLILLSIGIFTTCCGTNSGHQQADIDPVFDEYLTEIQPHLESRLISIRFMDSKDDYAPNIAGICQLQKRQILISPKSWSTGIREKKLALLAHEIIHCVHHVKHVHSHISDKNKLMSPYLYESTMCVLAFGLGECIDRTMEEILEGEIELHE